MSIFREIRLLLLLSFLVVSRDSLNEMAKTLDMEFDKFDGLFTECFCKCSTNHEFVYQLHEDGNEDRWKVGHMVKMTECKNQDS